MAAVLLGLGSLAARLDVPWTPPPPEASAALCGADEPVEGLAPALARIAVPDVRTRLIEGEVVLVDCRPSADFDAGHIPGAISLPADEIADMLASQSLPIPIDRDVVTYCSRGDADAEYVGRLLDTAIGCPRVHVLAGGWDAWLAAGAEVEGAPQSG